MNLIPGNCAPHYDEEPERRPSTKKLLMTKSIDFMYAIEGGAALHFINEKPESTIRFIKDKQAYKVIFKEDKVIEKPFKFLELGK
tara:strand:- start:366 stop:620 length:255 start_codon:yes stop_codon:yes gene_type:complete